MESCDLCADPSRWDADQKKNFETLQIQKKQIEVKQAKLKADMVEARKEVTFVIDQQDKLHWTMFFDKLSNNMMAQ